jgi:hypothetical protein
MRKCLIILTILFFVIGAFAEDSSVISDDVMKAIQLDPGNYPGLKSLCSAEGRGEAFKDIQTILGYKFGIPGDKIVCAKKNGKDIIRLEEKSPRSDNDLERLTRSVDALYKAKNEDNQPILKPLAKCVDKLRSVDGKDDPNCKNQMAILNNLAASSPTIIEFTRFVVNECQDAANVCPETGDTNEQFKNLEKVSQSLASLGHNTANFPNCLDLKKRLSDKMDAKEAAKAKEDAAKLNSTAKKKQATKNQTASALSSLMEQLSKTVSSMSSNARNSDVSLPGGGSVQSDFVPAPIMPDMPPNFSNSGQMLIQNESVLTLWHKRGYRFAGQHKLQQILRTDHEIRQKISANLESRGIPATMSNMVHYVQELAIGE